MTPATTLEQAAELLHETMICLVSTPYARLNGSEIAGQSLGVTGDYKIVFPLPPSQGLLPRARPSKSFLV